MRRLEKSRPARLYVTLYNSEEEPTNLSSGTLAVVVTNSAGTQVTTGNAVAVDMVLQVGQYYFSLTPTHTANLDVYTVTWTGLVEAVSQTITTYFEVVGAHYFTIGQAREFDNRALSSRTDYPTTRIQEVRDSVSRRIEEITGVSWVPRAKRVTLNGLGNESLTLPGLYPRRIVSLAVTDSGGTVDTYDATELADLVVYDWGQLTRKTLGSFTFGSRNVNVLFEHGKDSPPEPIQRAAKMMLRHEIVPSNIEDRTTSFTDESGTRQFAVANSKWKKWTGIPDVDSILFDFQEQVPVLA